MGKLKHSHNTISLCSAMFLDDCNAGRQCRLCFFEIFCIQSTSRPPKILYHKRGALSIRLRFRWRGAVCYTSQDLRSLTNAALLLARLRCPEFPAKGGAFLKIQTAAPLSPRFFRHRRRSATKQVIRPRAHNPRNRYSFLLLLQEKSSNTDGVEGFFWLREADLNHQPSGYEPDELPDCSIPRYLA